MSEVSEKCRGRWKEILSSLGVHHSVLTGKHGPCPFCGGEDRFRFTDKNGYGFFVCNQCGSGDGFTFLMRFKGIKFLEALRLVEPIVGKVELHPQHLEQLEEKKRRLEEARKMWVKAVPITADCHAGVYLTRRTGITKYPSSLRYTPLLEYREGGEMLGHFPAMLAFVSGQNGQMVNITRTYIDEDGYKANIKNPRKSLRGALPAGSAIRLGPIYNGKLVVAEGLETAISASKMHDCTGYSLISADRMRVWVPPQGVNHIIVAGDNDLSYTGQAAAYILANRLVCQFKVPKVEVSIPMEAGKDWNDVWGVIECNDRPDWRNGRTRSGDMM